MAKYLLNPNENPDERHPEPYVSMAKLESFFRTKGRRETSLGHVTGRDDSGFTHGRTMIRFIADVAHPDPLTATDTRLREQEVDAVDLAHANLLQHREKSPKRADAFTSHLYREASASRDELPFIAAAIATEGTLNANNHDAAWLARRITAAAQYVRLNPDQFVTPGIDEAIPQNDLPQLGPLPDTRDWKSA